MRRRCRLAFPQSLVVTAGAVLALAAPASAAGEFVLLDGPGVGGRVPADENGFTGAFRERGRGEIRPQAGGCDYQWKGTLDGVETTACASPVGSLTPAYLHLASAIRFEQGALWQTRGNRVTDQDLGHAAVLVDRGAADSLDRWSDAVDVEVSPGPTHDDLVAKQASAKANDELADAKFTAASSRGGQRRAELIDEARGLVEEALVTKRAAFAIVLENVPIDGRVATASGSLPAPIDLSAGTALSLIGPNDILGAHNPGTVNSQAWHYDGAMATDIAGGAPSTAYAFGPDKHVMGDHEFDPAYAAALLDEAGWTAIGDDPGSVRGANDYGGVGFRFEGGAEVATWFRKDFDGADPGFKVVDIGSFPGGASLFTVNDSNLAFGDFFLSGSTGPFRAFSVQLKSEKVTNLFRPSGGSTQPRASNDNGVAAGGALFQDSSVEGIYFWGKKHYLPYAKLAQNTLINGINDAGVAVGSIGPSDNTNAALFVNGQAIDLNTLIPGGSGWDLNRANDIDEDGNIVGTGTLGGQDRAFLIRGGNTVTNDLELKKTVEDGKGPQHNVFKNGRPVHFKVTLTNHGPREAKEVRIVDHIPKHCKFDRIEFEPPKQEKSVTVFKPDKGEDGGDVSVALERPMKVGATVTFHVYCTAKVTTEETFTNKSEVSTHSGQVEPAPDPHPNLPDADYVLKP